MEGATETGITASGWASQSDAQPFAVHRIFSMEMINPNPSPTWRTAFRIGNKYLADTEPWKVVKTDPARVETILNIALQITEIGRASCRERV